jgi:hypothetical protein
VQDRFLSSCALISFSFFFVWYVNAGQLSGLERFYADGGQGFLPSVGRVILKVQGSKTAVFFV